MDRFEQLTAEIAAFSDERDWGQFHSPKNLAMALNVEAGELLEHFQWLSEKESADLAEDRLGLVAKEIADVQIYLMRLADRLGLDVLDAVGEKLAENRRKYPAERVRGSARKYTEYDEEPPSES